MSRMLFMPAEVEPVLFNKIEQELQLANGEMKHSVTQVRLKEIQRKHRCFYDFSAPINGPVDILEAYQDWDDVYNEFRGIFFKPLICGYFIALHSLNLSLELSTLAINILTLNPQASVDSLVMVSAEAIRLTGYLLLEAVTDATVVPIFVVRGLMTVIDGLFRLIPEDTVEYQPSNLSAPNLNNLQNAEEITENDLLQNFSKNS